MRQIIQCLTTSLANEYFLTSSRASLLNNMNLLPILKFHYYVIDWKSLNLLTFTVSC